MRLNSRIKSRTQRSRRRRGIVGVLAMMFLVMFASLATAMAVATQGNMRSASSHLHVVRSLGAVDSGMRLAESRLQSASSRFLVTRGLIDAAYVDTLWFGPVPAEPEVKVLDAPGDMVETTTPGSIQAAIANIHYADNTTNTIQGMSPTNAPAPIVVLDRGEDWLVTLPIGIARNDAGQIVTATQVSYGPPENGEFRVVVTGYDWDPVRARWVERTAEQRFRVTKRIEFAMISTVATQLGQGASVKGPIGVLFDSSDLDTIDGPPFTARSDFHGLNPVLDQKLDDFYAVIRDYDTNGDNRLSLSHATESAGVSLLNVNDYSGNGEADNAFRDMTRNGYIDDFDIFLFHFDSNDDGRVVLSNALTAGTPNEGQTPEFTVNDTLAELIDGGFPDRNRNGRRNGRLINGAWDWTTFPDNNGDGIIDSSDIDHGDIVLGYRDGVLDHRDRYAKVAGSIRLRASKSAWEAAIGPDGNPVGNYQQFVEGPIRAPDGEPPMVFDADEDILPEIDATSFQAASTMMIALVQASGAPSFAQQVAAQRGGGWTPPIREEATPFGSTSAADWYRRPVYENMVFKNVKIPIGTNALFINCEFIGITFIETYPDNTHPSWTFYGELERNPSSGQLELKYPPPPAESNQALDQSYSTPGAPGYDSLPPPLMVYADLDGSGVSNQVCYDTKLVSNNLRFHNCLFVGSVVSNKPHDYTHIRNKIQFSGATRFTQSHPDFPNDPGRNPDSEHLDAISRSSMMLPHFSVDIGAINPPQTQDVRLQGAIVAGVLDVRGNASLRGVLLSTFRPKLGEPPLVLYGTPVGNPANFNSSIGYLTIEDGDMEGIDPSKLQDLNGDGHLDIGWEWARDANGNLILLSDFAGDPNDDALYSGVPDPGAGVDTDHVKRPVRWNGMGITRIESDPEAPLPDGLALPMSIRPVPGSYQEGRL